MAPGEVLHAPRGRSYMAPSGGPTWPPVEVLHGLPVEVLHGPLVVPNAPPGEVLHSSLVRSYMDPCGDPTWATGVPTSPPTGHSGDLC